MGDLYIVFLCIFAPGISTVDQIPIVVVLLVLEQQALPFESTRQLSVFDSYELYITISIKKPSVPMNS